MLMSSMAMSARYVRPLTPSNTTCTHKQNNHIKHFKRLNEISKTIKLIFPTTHSEKHHKCHQIPISELEQKDKQLHKSSLIITDIILTSKTVLLVKHNYISLCLSHGNQALEKNMTANI